MTKSEIVIGLVGPIGTNLDQIESILGKVLSEFNYNPNFLKVSSFFDEPHFKQFKLTHKRRSAFETMLSKMEDGNRVREKTDQNDYLAAYGISKIFATRNPVKGNLQGTAHIFRSLKNPAESRLLRNVYGVGFYQIGVYSSEQNRIDYLTKNRKLKKNEALELIEKDIGEEVKFGQQTRDTGPGPKNWNNCKLSLSTSN